METYSKETIRQLKIFLQHWLHERRPNDVLTIDSDRILFSNNFGIQEIHLYDFIGNCATVLEKCVEDLRKEGVTTIPVPDYVGQDDEQRLETLLHLTQQPSFHRRKTLHRIETFYYLGEVLTLRGWRKKDARRIRELFSTNKGASEFKKTAKRVYELFQARGLANLYAVTYIRPHHQLIVQYS
uniref:Uncharacterized protein n=1 Tax=Rhizophagus irregularis (strain DAOM 181602 / DAOM 197198 / MUCL 43194) TaxID=747089 RepID=U9TCA9_RHIID